MEKILLIDDNRDFCESVKKTLHLHHYHVEYTTQAEEGLEMALSNQWGTILLDVVLNQALDGIQILKRVIEKKPSLPVIMISGISTLDTALQATRMGAYDFLEKPLNVDRLLLTIDRALEKSRLTLSNQELLRKLSDRHQLVGKSPSMQKLIAEVERVAKTNAKVFLWGESGVGKDLLARIIHYHSEREKYPFIAVNCAAIPENLIESELFGYKKGAFTGADQDKEGLIAQAEKGTLFLDDITELSLNAQAKLLKFLQDGQYTPLGSHETIQSDVRIISATNKDIHQEIQAGRFRQDLFFRLNVVNIYIPPLRERKEDIPLLAEFFLQEANEKFDRKISHLSPEVIELLKGINWQGNVRQLRAAIERMVLFSNNHFIDYGTASTAIQMDKTTETVLSESNYQSALKEFERLYFLNLYYSQNQDVEKTARIADLPVYVVEEKLQNLGIINNPA